MVSALLRILFIAITSVIFIGASLMFLRWLGLSQEFAPLNHPLAQKPFLIFADGGDTSEAPPQTITAIKALNKTCSECIAKVDARRSLDGIWYIYPNHSLKKWTGEEGYLSLTLSEKIDQLKFISDSGNLPVVRLTHLIEEFPDQAFLVVIHSRDASQLNEVLTSLKERKSQENLIIQSPFRQILTDARKERPTWLFGVSPSGLARLMMMEALYIETMSNIWSDLIISPEKVHNTTVFTDRLIDEFERRHKLVIVEHPDQLDQLPVKLQKSMDGVITYRIKEAQAFFNSRKSALQ